MTELTTQTMTTALPTEIPAAIGVLQRLSEDGLELMSLPTDIDECPAYLRAALNADHRDLWSRITNEEARRRLITQAEADTARRQRRMERDRIRQDAVGAYIDALCRIVDVPAADKPAAHAELQRLRDQWSEVKKNR